MNRNKKKMDQFTNMSQILEDRFSTASISKFVE